MPISARIEGVRDGVLRGWAWDSGASGRRLSIGVRADGMRLGIWKADRLRGDLRRNNIGDGAHGLECVLPSELQDGATHLFTFHLAETADEPELASANCEVPRRPHMLDGRVERLQGRQLIGWVWDRDRPTATIDVALQVEGRTLAVTAASRFRKDLLRGGIGHGGHGFVFDLDSLARPPATGALLVVATTEAEGGWEIGAIVLQGDANPPTTPPAPAGKVAEPDKAVQPDRTAAPPTPLHRVALDEARDAERRRDFDAAAKHADRGLALAPRNFDLLFIRSRIALASVDIDAAERFALAALAEQPAQIRPQVILARVASVRGAHTEAAERWALVPPGDGYYRERLIKRGRSLLAIGRAHEALAEFATAVSLDPTDRDALRGAAEAADAAGGLRTALRRWRSYAAIATDDARARERIADLTARLAPQQGLGSPLRNPTLHEWPLGTEGDVGAHSVEISPGITLRSLASSGLGLSYAAAEASQQRPGELHRYGLWLGSEGGAEVSFAIDPAARPTLIQGLRMGIEIRMADGPTEDMVPAELLLGGTDAPRVLLALRLGSRRRMARFDLRLSDDEVAALERHRLSLMVRITGPGRVLLSPPRPLAALRTASSMIETFEMAGATALARTRPKVPPAAADVLRDTARPFTPILITPDPAEPGAVLPAVEATLAAPDAPPLCALLQDPGWPEELRVAVAAQAARDPRLRLLMADQAIPAEGMLRRSAAEMMAR